MKRNKDVFLIELDKAILLGLFKAFCEKYNSTDKKVKLRNIMYYSSNHLLTIQNLFKSELEESLEEAEAKKMDELVNAFLNKSTHRKNIPDSKKKSLLSQQDYKCAICNSTIDIHTADADHIVPFKYVGDELDNNLQMLCSHCNKTKNASIDYQIRYWLKLVKEATR